MRVAAELSRQGVLPGDHVAVIGREYDHEFWARELRVRIVVQIPDHRWFLRADSATVRKFCRRSRRRRRAG